MAATMGQLGTTGVDPDEQVLRLDWLERFAAISKRVLLSHWREILDARESANLRVRSADAADLLATMERNKASFRRGVARCSSEFTTVAFGASGPHTGPALTKIILQELMPLAIIAEDALTAGHDEGNGRSRRESGSDAARFSLTRQEVRVLRLLPGLTNRQIAEHLRSSPETVKTQVSRVLRKLQAHDRAHAVAIGMSTGLIPDRFGADDFESSA